MDADGYICVTDFGLSKILKGTEVATTGLGTPDYMAPEMLKKENYSFSVDWWTLGCLIYELTVGASPFLVNNPNMKEHVRDRIQQDAIKNKPFGLPTMQD